MSISARERIAIIALASSVVFAVAETLATRFGFVFSTSAFASIALVLVAGLACGACTYGTRRAIQVSIAASACFALLYFWPMTPRKLFFRDMLDIRTGMSREAVRELAASWESGHPYGTTPWFGMAPRDIDCFHHGEGGPSFSADHCEVRYANDRVVSVELVFD